MTKPRARDASASRLQSLLAQAETNQPRIPPARPGDLRPLARVVAAITGRITGTGTPTSSRRSAGTRACSAPGCVIRRS